MEFANPLFLFGLVALAIPVIIHLFNFRKYRKHYFTNVRFLSAIRQETRKRSRLKQWLILLCRLLAVTALVLAFTRPYIPSSLLQKKASGQEMMSIYLDNSLSMETPSDEGTLLETAKEKAVEIAQASSPGTRFQLFTNEESSSNRTMPREDFIEKVREVSYSRMVKNMSDIAVRQNEGLRNIPAGNRFLCIISDFQKSTADLSRFSPDTSGNYIFVPLGEGRNDNIYIDSVWFDSPSLQPDRPARLTVAITNTRSDAAEKLPVRMTINGKQKAVSAGNLQANETTLITMPFTNDTVGWQQGRVEITDQPVTFDNVLFFSYFLNSTWPVLSLHGTPAGSYLNALFSSDSTFQFTSASPERVDYSSLRRYSVIFFHDLPVLSSGLTSELMSYVADGGCLVVFPSAGPDAGATAPLLREMGIMLSPSPDTNRVRVDHLELESPLFDDVFERDASGTVTLPENPDFPSVFSHFRLLGTPDSSGAEVLMRLENKDAFLSRIGYGKGTVYLFASSLDVESTNFPRHPLFVPVLYRIAMLSRNPLPLFYYTGSNEPIGIQNDTIPGSGIFKIRSEDGTFESIPVTRNAGNRLMLFPGGQVTQPGHYAIKRDDLMIYRISFNIPPAESEPQSLTRKEIADMASRAGITHAAILKDNAIPAGRQIREFQQGTPLWKVFVIICLGFLAVEILLIRIIK